jgi:Flp pilus assembly protein TadG
MWAGSYGRTFASRRGVEDGSTVIEAVLVIPVLMLLLLLVVQFALWSHAAQVAQLAASTGDRTARAVGGGPAQGVDRAQSILTGPGSDVTSSNVTYSILPGDMVEITVTGSAESILPGLSLPVSAKLVGPVQEFRSSE